MFAVSAYIYATRNFAHDTSIFWLVFCGPDCNMIAKQGGGPDGRPSWAGSGPRAGGCPPLLHKTTRGRRGKLANGAR